MTLLAGAPRAELHRYEAVEPHMGTLVRITVYSPDEQAAGHAFPLPSIASVALMPSSRTTAPTAS